MAMVIYVRILLEFLVTSSANSVSSVNYTPGTCMYFGRPIGVPQIIPGDFAGMRTTEIQTIRRDIFTPQSSVQVSKIRFSSNSCSFTLVTVECLPTFQKQLLKLFKPSWS